MDAARPDARRTGAPASDAVDPMLMATLGATFAPAQAAAPQDSPVGAWLAAAVGRALGSFAAPPQAAHVAQPAAADATPAVDATAAAAAATGLDKILSMTPLEQAVHELIGRIAEREPARGPRTVATTGADAELTALPSLTPAPTATTAMVGSDPAAPTAAPRAANPIQLPEPPANPSHVHLVLDDGPERVVVTVAMRGNDVHVAMRSPDDTTTAALARNAASLDHAMRARGLVLGELTAEHEPAQDRRQPQDREPRERREPHAEPFKLEETP